MIPLLGTLLAKPAIQTAGNVIKSIPREVWYALAVGILLLLLRAHWIGVGVEQEVARNAKALEKALKESVKQEEKAPEIAQEAREAVKPIVETRIKVIRENIPVNSCPDYGDIVQSEVRKAATASD